MSKQHLAVYVLLAYVGEIKSQDTEVIASAMPEYVRFSSENSIENEWAQSLLAKPLPNGWNLKTAMLQFLAESTVDIMGLGFAMDEIALQDVQHRPDDDRVYAYLNVSRSGIPLSNCTMRFTFVESTRILLSLKMPMLNEWTFSSTLPSIESDTALASAAKLIPDSVKAREPLLVYHPVYREKAFMLSWDMELTRTGLGAFRVLVSAINGEPLEIIAGGFELDATGTVRGYSTPLSSRLPDYSGNPPQIQSVPNIQVTIQPGNGSGNTNSSGAFSIATAQQTVTASTVVNTGTFMAAVQDNPLASDQASGLTNIQLVLNDVPSDPNRKRFTAQLNAWQFVALGRQFLDTIYARTAVPFVSNPMFESNCSAYSSGDPPAHVRWKIQLRPNHTGTCIDNGVALYYEDCLPTIELREELAYTHNVAYSSPVCHEFGHYFAFEMTNRGSSGGHSPHHSEALADVISAYILNDPVIGKGMLKGSEASSFLRNLATGIAAASVCDQTWSYQDTFYVWPTTNADRPHKKGLPYSGAWWDLRVRLMQDFPVGGEGRKVAEDLLIKYYDSIGFNVLDNVSYMIAEDLIEIDDCPYFGGNSCLSDGSPHKAQIVDSFVRRNLYRRKFRRGDANADGALDITDGRTVRNWLFLGGPEPPCHDSADANGDNVLDISDGTFFLNWLFSGGPEPPNPGPFTCGYEVAWDDNMTCISYPPCDTAPTPCP